MYNSIMQTVMQENKEIEHLLKNISEGLKKYSVKELNQAIVTVLNKKHDKRKEVDFVLKIVAKKYNINVKILKTGKGRGELQDAKQHAYCLLHLDLKIPIRHIAKRIFFNWPNSVQKGINRCKNVNSNIKTDRDFIDIYTQLQQELIKFITEQK